MGLSQVVREVCFVIEVIVLLLLYPIIYSLFLKFEMKNLNLNNLKHPKSLFYEITSSHKLKLCGTIVGIYLMYKTYDYLSSLHVLNSLKRKGLSKRMELLNKEHIVLSLKKPKLYNEILKMSTKQLRESVINGQITCKDIIITYSYRSYECRLNYNCILEEHYDTAYNIASDLDKEIANKKNKLSKEEYNKWLSSKPFLGIPFSIKDLFIMNNSDCTGGIYDKCMNKFDYDGSFIKLIKYHGGIPLVKTNVPQAYMLPETYNNIIGFTYNPYNKKRTVGGSSGGDACIVAANGCKIGLGTDIGGSLRMPANFCGLNTHKSSSKRCMRTGRMGLTSKYLDKHVIMSSSGPLCQNIDDVVEFMKILFSKEAFKLDPCMVPLEFDNNKYLSSSQLVIGFLANDGWITPIDTVYRCINKCKNYIKTNTNHKLIDVSQLLQSDKYRNKIWPHKYLTSFGEYVLELYLSYLGAIGNMKDYEIGLKGENLSGGFKLVKFGSDIPNYLRPIIIKLLQLTNQKRTSISFSYGRDGGVTVQQLRKINLKIDTFRYEFYNMMKENKIDVILSPINFGCALPHRWADKGIITLTTTFLQNLLDCPSSSVGPICYVNENECNYNINNLVEFQRDKLSKNIKEWIKNSQNLPCGLQIFGKLFDDEICLRVAKLLEPCIEKKEVKFDESDFTCSI